MKFKRGQSLLELIIAIGIFTIVISGLAFLILESYISGRLASEITIANFLAEEGLEAAKSIRDNSWTDLAAGNHGLAISGGHWIFPQGITEEDINNQLKAGKRIIQVEDIGPDRKKVTSQVTWQFSEDKVEEVKLVTYLTNWQRETFPSDCTGTPTPCDNFWEEPLCFSQEGCSWTSTFCGGACTPCEELNRGQCRQQDGCIWFFFTCVGTCTSCNTYQNQTDCEDQLGCIWYPATCSGIPFSCEFYQTEQDCLSQDGCEWIGE